MAGSNTIEFRLIEYVDSSGNATGTKPQFRTKDTIIGVLGVSLGTWSDWMDYEAAIVVVNL